MKAYLYIRVSGIGQLDGDGPERQEQFCREYAETNGIEIVQIFTESYTGKELVRPVLQELIAKVLANGVRTILIEKLDRLARDIVVQESLIRDFQKRGITLLSTKETDLCSKEPTRVMIRQMLGVLSEYERAMIVFRTKAAKDRIRARGERCEGKKPYGQHPNRPTERPILERILHLSQHLSPREIAEILNNDGIKPRLGDKWFPNTVRRIVKRSA